MLESGESVTVTGDGLKPAASGLVPKGNPKTQIRPGAVIRLVQGDKNAWSITQLPEVEGAFVSLDPRTGAVRTMVGGFDYSKSKFNHVTQAWRQPGSSFKPFIYSAALEKGFTPATVINDAPLFFDAGATGSQPWEPKNYDGTFDGPMSMRNGAGEVEEPGLDPDPASRSARLCAELGHALRLRRREAPRLPDDGARRRRGHAAADGQRPTACSRTAATASIRCLISASPIRRAAFSTKRSRRPPDEPMRTIDARNAFVMDSLLQEVTRTRHGGAGAGARSKPPRHLRQDRHHQRFARRLVRRLPAEHGRGGLDRLRQPAQARGQGDRRRARAADLDRLHEDGAQGRAGPEPTRARWRDERRRRVVLRGIRAAAAA